MYPKRESHCNAFLAKWGWTNAYSYMHTLNTCYMYLLRTWFANKLYNNNNNNKQLIIMIIMFATALSFNVVAARICMVWNISLNCCTKAKCQKLKQICLSMLLQCDLFGLEDVIKTSLITLPQRHNFVFQRCLSTKDVVCWWPCTACSWSASTQKAPGVDILCVLLII